MRLGKRQLGAASCVLGPSAALPAHLRDVVEVSEVFVPEWHRRKGIASRLLRQVCDDADAHGKVLMLMPDGDDWLPAWYARFGFVAIQNNPVLMARQPFQREEEHE